MIRWIQRRRALNRPVTAREMIDCLNTLERISNQVLDVARVHVHDESEAWQRLFWEIIGLPDIEIEDEDLR